MTRNHFRRIYTAWMAFAYVLGAVLSKVYLTLFFFLVLTPFAVISRLLGKTYLELSVDSRSDTYWKRTTQPVKEKKSYERQF